MLYQVRLQYAIHVEAADKRDAFNKACCALRDNPGSHISQVKQPDEPKSGTTLLKRLVKGQ